MTVSQPVDFSKRLRSAVPAFFTSQVAEELLVRSRRKEINPVVLASGSWNRTCQLANADKDRKVAKPYDYEAVYQTGRSAAVIGVNDAGGRGRTNTYLVKPMEKMLP